MSIHSNCICKLPQQKAMIFMVYNILLDIEVLMLKGNLKKISGVGYRPSSGDAIDYITIHICIDPNRI